MSRSIEEIMNRELLAVVPGTPVQAIRELLRTFAIGVVPVLSEARRPLGMVTTDAALAGGGTAGDRMSRPAMCIEGSAGIEAAARRLVLADAHHMVVVDSAGVAVGIVSVLDILRAMLGISHTARKRFHTGTQRQNLRGRTSGRSTKSTQPMPAPGCDVSPASGYPAAKARARDIAGGTATHERHESGGPSEH